MINFSQNSKINALFETVKENLGELQQEVEIESQIARIMEEMLQHFGNKYYPSAIAKALLILDLPKDKYFERIGKAREIIKQSVPYVYIKKTYGDLEKDRQYQNFVDQMNHLYKEGDFNNAINAAQIVFKNPYTFDSKTILKAAKIEEESFKYISLLREASDLFLENKFYEAFAKLDPFRNDFPHHLEANQLMCACINALSGNI